MKNYSRRCVFLSMDNLHGHVVDDELAVAPLAERGVSVENMSWRRQDIDWDDYDWVIVRSTWDYQSDVDAFLASLAAIDASRATLANPLEVMKNNVDKRYLAALRDRGVEIVPTEFGSDLNETRLAELIRTAPNGRGVIKPVVSAGSHNTFVVHESLSAAERSAVVVAHANNDWMFQPFVDAVLDPGEYSVFIFDGRIAHTILKTPKAGDFRVQEEYGGDIRGVTPDAALLAAARQAYAAIDARLLYARIDLIELDGRYCLMEAELIEPSLYLRCDSHSPVAFADACVSWFDTQESM